MTVYNNPLLARTRGKRTADARIACPGSAVQQPPGSKNNGRGSANCADKPPFIHHFFYKLPEIFRRSKVFSTGHTAGQYHQIRQGCIQHVIERTVAADCKIMRRFDFGSFK